MSAHDAHTDPALHAHGSTHGHGTRKSYLTGFALSAVLTAIPFWLVMTGAIANAQVAAAVVVALAFVQILVHTFFFLHINTKAEGGWTLMALIFTVVIVAIVITGSLWIMYHLAGNMMPMTPSSMPTAP
jgi:cytochrome o ubiquinol oxidase operon protein cyoD